jgi:hypothetical protein
MLDAELYNQCTSMLRGKLVNADGLAALAAQTHARKHQRQGRDFYRITKAMREIDQTALTFKSACTDALLQPWSGAAVLVHARWSRALAIRT